MKKLVLLTVMVMSSTVFANNDRGDNNGYQPTSSIQGQAQGQRQLQFQGQSIDNRNSNSNRNYTSSGAFSGASSKSSSTANPTSYSAGGVVTGVVSSSPVSGATGTGTGGTAQAEAGSGGNVLSSTYNQVKQAPMAWSPNMAMSYSSDNCNNSATFGMSAGFGAFSGGAPINDDDCTRRRDATLWANLGQMRVACERMLMDEDNAAAMQKAGLTCASITQPVSTPVAVVKPVQPQVDWDAMAKQRDKAFAKGKW